MKILVLSDVHLEFYHDAESVVINSFPRDGFDVVVLAGDIVSGLRSAEVLTQLCDHFYPHPIIFVRGNHELYHSNRQISASMLRGIERRKSNFTWLENGEVTIAGQRFIGTTLWFRRDYSTETRDGFLSDFRLIEDFREWVYKANAEAVGFLSDNANSDTVVITHHLPVEASIHPKYKGDKFNCFFLCDMEPMILDKKPPLWIHGHTHESVDCMVGKTRVVCNPMGYPHEDNRAFSASKIVEV